MSYDEAKYEEVFKKALKHGEGAIRKTGHKLNPAQRAILKLGIEIGMQTVLNEAAEYAATKGFSE
jgi:hypothetical protein